MKKVTFSGRVEIHHMIYWTFAYRKARQSKWMQDAVDSHRFRRRIDNIGKILEPILTKPHRDAIFSRRL